MQYQKHTRPSNSWFLILVLGIIAYVVVVATAASAQDYPKAKLSEDRDNGFYLGLGVGGTHFDAENNGTSTFSIEEGGGALQLFLGYSFNPVFSLELALTGSGHDTTDPRIEVQTGALEIFAQYHFLPGKPVRPFIKGGFGGYGFEITDNTTEVTASGGGLGFGGGVDYFASKHFSIGLDYTLSLTKYDKLEVDLNGLSAGTDIDEDGAIGTLLLVAGFYF